MVVFLHIRNEVIVNEVARSHDPNLVTFTGHTFLQQAQDDDHDYESLPLQTVPPDLPARAKEPTAAEQVSNEYVEIPSLATARVLESKQQMLDSDIKSMDATHASTSSLQESLYEDMSCGQAKAIPDDENNDTDLPAQAKELTVTEKVSNEYVEVPSLAIASVLESKPKMLDDGHTISDIVSTDTTHASTSFTQELIHENMGYGQADAIPEDKTYNL